MSFVKAKVFSLEDEISKVSSSIADTYNPLNIYEEGDFTIKD